MSLRRSAGRGRIVPGLPTGHSNRARATRHNGSFEGRISIYWHSNRNLADEIQNATSG
jgi:hypothetical protein